VPVLGSFIPFKMKGIKFALDNWPGEFKKMAAAGRAQALVFITTNNTRSSVFSY
jgi:hypothetical protein